ncbi:MAG: ABC transporter permease subunit [Bryobacteraceae bacterium]
MFSYDWNWSVIWLYRFVFLQGLVVTFALSAVSIVAGTLAGLGLGVGLSGQSRSLVVLRAPILFCIDAIKALPPLILLLLFYYWLPYAVGVRSSFWLAAIALAVGLSAFVADVFRHAISGVPKPLIDACYALGMTRSTALRRLVVPEALRSIVPTLALLYIDIFKLTSLASIIAVGELVHRASEVSTHSYRFLEVYATLAVIYLAILLPFSYLARRLETSAQFIRRS